MKSFIKLLSKHGYKEYILTEHQAEELNLIHNIRSEEGETVWIRQFSPTLIMGENVIIDHYPEENYLSMLEYDGE